MGVATFLYSQAFRKISCNLATRSFNPLIISWNTVARTYKSLATLATGIGDGLLTRVWNVSSRLESERKRHIFLVARVARRYKSVATVILVTVSVLRGRCKSDMRMENPLTERKFGARNKCDYPSHKKRS